MRAMAGAMVHPARDEDAFLLEDPRHDGAVFLRYGSVDVALGWPLRYADSPVEVIDTKDLDALGEDRGSDRAEAVSSTAPAHASASQTQNVVFIEDAANDPSIWSRG